MKANTISERIDAWGTDTPKVVCFRDEHQEYTYRELKKASDAIANYLLSKHTNTLPVIVFGGLGYEMIVTFLGCAKAGHAYIPIDSHTPSERIGLIADVADYATIIAWEDWPLPDNPLVVTADEAREIMTRDVNEAVNQSVTGDENFYIIFTSGTTGVPKGVQISHDNLVSYTDWMLQDFGLLEGQNFLSQAPYSFDLSVMDVYPALLSGGQLTPLTKDTVNDFKQLFTVLPKMGLNVWVSTPSFADICLMEPRFNGTEMASVNTFLFCGEELTHSTAEKLLTRFPKAKIMNTYGPTEATVAITQVEVTSKLLADYPRLPIGSVKSDTKVYIMDEEGKILPNGEIGEIVIVGPCVSKGYYNNPEKTDEAFFIYEETQSYRTGDAGVFKDNLLFYKGRMDFQIKLHGYRIELEDVDHHLSDSSYVKAGVVVPKYQQFKVQQLVAYVVPNGHSFKKEYQLTKAIKEKMKMTVMDYMIPQKFVYVEALPLTQNGKIDRKGLINEVNGT